MVEEHQELELELRVVAEVAEEQDLLVKMVRKVQELVMVVMVDLESNLQFQDQTFGTVQEVAERVMQNQQVQEVQVVVEQVGTQVQLVEQELALELVVVVVHITVVVMGQMELS
jgi:hypothetical protein